MMIKFSNSSSDRFSNQLGDKYTKVLAEMAGVEDLTELEDA